MVKDAAPVPRLWLLGRPWCSLCDTMAERLVRWATGCGVEVKVVDIDEHLGWLSHYDERIPVVVAGPSLAQDAHPDAHRLVCEVRFDQRACDVWLSAARAHG
jgi:Glutaredoxin-like domain (DUF836)